MFQVMVNLAPFSHWQAGVKPAKGNEIIFSGAVGWRELKPHERS